MQRLFDIMVIFWLSLCQAVIAHPFRLPERVIFAIDIFE